MTIEVCGVLLAAGEGVRLRPLTEVLPKALCPVGNVALLDRGLARFDGLGLPVAVNAAYLKEQIVRHVGERTQPDTLAGRQQDAGHLGGHRAVAACGPIP
jgi:MurNAc alpha-1-phosphate uridylyltransferase